MSNSQYIYTFKSEFESDNGQVIKNEAEEIEFKNDKGTINKYKDNKKISSKKINKKEINLQDFSPLVTQMSPFISLGKIPNPKDTQESPMISPNKSNKKVYGPKKIKSPKKNNKKK